MEFKDLLRISALLIAAEATALAAIGIVGAAADNDTTTLYVALGWWLAAIAIGAWIGRPERAADAVAGPLAAARTTTAMPEVNTSRAALQRLWPIGAFALAAGGVGLVFPQVAVVGAGYALLVALAWRRREAAVTAVEERDGVCFLVEPGSAFEPISLVRTPGLRRDV